MAPPRKNTPGVCSKCGESDPKAFTPAAFKVKRTAWCKACMRAYKKEPQANGQPRSARYQQRFRRKRKAWLSDLKAKRGCERCGEKDPCCLDWHHREAASKSFHIGTKIYTVGEARALEEMKKCVVLCSNCHRKLHFHEGSGIYARILPD